MMDTRDEIDELLQSCDMSSLFADGFDDAIIGVSQDGYTGSFRVCYSVTRCYDALIADGMTEEEAIEYFEYNVLAASMGPTTPIFII
jgi:hypothetical protein